MGHVETILRILGPGGALSFVGIGLSMARFDEFRTARILFWFAALLLGSTDFFWQLTTTEVAWFRILSGLIAGIAVFVIFPILLEWLHKRETEWLQKQSNTPPAQSLG